MRWFDVRMAVRLHRFELVGAGILVAILSLAAFVVAGRLDATGYGDLCPQDGSGGPMCESIGAEFYGIQGALVSPVQAVLLLLPFLLAALVGAPLVARELERGTSRLAWSLAPSRLRWLVGRLVPMLVLVFGFAFLAGVALDRLMGAVDPWGDPSASFAGYGNRGVVFAARATFVFGIGVAVGAVLGRMLPALLVTVVIASLALTGGMQVHQVILRGEAVWLDQSAGIDGGRTGDLYVDERIRSPEGELLTWDQLYERIPQTEDTVEWPPAGYTTVMLGVPGERYRLVELREVAALGGGTLVTFGIAALAVRRRRPD